MSEHDDTRGRRPGRGGNRELSDENRAAAWLGENKAAIASSDADVEVYGLRLAALRQL